MKEAKDPTTVQVAQKKEWKKPIVEIISSNVVQGGYFAGSSEGSHQAGPFTVFFYHS